MTMTTYVNPNGMGNQECYIRQNLRNFLLVGSLAAQGIFQNSPNWRGDISLLLNSLSLQCISSGKDILHKTIEKWKTTEHLKIESDQHLSPKQAEHLRAGVDWLANFLKWIVDDAFFRF